MTKTILVMAGLLLLSACAATTGQPGAVGQRCQRCYHFEHCQHCEHCRHCGEKGETCTCPCMKKSSGTDNPGMICHDPDVAR